MTGFDFLTRSFDSFLRIGAREPVGMVLTVAFVMFMNLVTYLLRKIWG